MLLVGSSLLIAGQRFSASQKQICVFPANFSIGSVNIAGLTAETAKDRIKQVYEGPISLKIDDSTIQLFPNEMGVTNNIDEAVERASKPCDQMNAWNKFWYSIWNKPVSGFESQEVSVNLDESVIQAFVDEEIINRYIELPLISYALPGTTQFSVGKPGSSIDRDALIALLEKAFQSVTDRNIEITTTEISSIEPQTSQIEYLLKDNIQRSGFEGIVEIYLLKLSSAESIHFALQNGNPVTPDIAFTAASTMKIPIMVSSLLRENDPVDEMVTGWLNYMIKYSQNDPADRLMERIDPVSGPLIVTNDMHELGLQNTFISGYFYFGAPLLDIVSTPANSRSDINVDPDMYNQTTTSDIAGLLSEIYTCAENGTGKLVEYSNQKMTAEKCQMMIDTLSKNKIGALIEAGLPEGTQIAHKHGWSEESDGLLHTVSDVAIVYGPENDYVFVIFVYSPQQLLFERADYLVAELAQTAFNGLNPNHQIAWEFSEN
jgi:beta-lactamase class A